MAIPDDNQDVGGGDDNGHLRRRHQRVPSVEETQQEGRELFEHFLQQTLLRRGVANPSSIIYDYQPDQAISSHGLSGSDRNRQSFQSESRSYQQIPTTEYDLRRSVQSYSKPEWESIGKNMNSLMSDFARSQQRKDIERLTRGINIHSINREDFVQFLTSYLGDGSNLQLRVIGLFFFCSDIIYRAALEVAIEYGRKFVQWSLNFIMDNITKWVLASGGWAEVFKVHGQTILISFVCGMLGMAACLFFLKLLKK